MKTFVRIGLFFLALVTAGLVGGCASHRSSASAPRRSTDFEVVETSTKRQLTVKEMLQLHAAVANYLVKEGAVADGDYYVKVYLTAEQDGVPAEWVVVRFTRDAERRYSLVASNPSYAPGSYVAYDYYPYGYDNFSRISFQYYDDPYYGNNYYFPPRHYDRNRNHDGRHDGGKDRERGRDHDRDRDDHAGSQDRPGFKPIPPVGSDQVARPRRDSNPADQANQPRWRRDDTTRRPEGRSEAGNASSRTDRFPRHGGEPASRQVDAAPERTARQPVARSESSSRESSRTNDSGGSYNPPAARSESNQNSDSDRSPRETKGTGSVFSRGRD
jgi:hypothetical protein